MATITGSGGVLNVSSLVSQLVEAEASALAAPITRHEVAVTTKISALGSLKGALSAFKAALDPLKTTAAFQTRKVAVADTDFFSATADGTSAAGHYDVEVVDIAQAHQLKSNPFDQGSSHVVGHGTLKITVGSKSFEVTIPADKSKLSDIRDAINTAADNAGVQATLLNGTGGATLILTASSTGAANAIKVEASGGDDGLDALVYVPNGTTNLTELRPAADGKIKIAGETITSTTNTFANAIDGVTITAKKVSEGDQIGLDVTLDTAAISSRITKFVTEYNTMQTALGKLGSYNAATKVAGAMVGDALFRSVQDQIRRDISNPVPGLSGNYTTLASIGITTNLQGSLEIDSAKLNAALTAAPDAVAKLFGSTDGVAARMSSGLEKRLATDGDIETRNTRLTNELKDIDKDKQALNLRLSQMESRYRKQFVALDSLLTRMQSTSSYLAQQLANLPKVSGSN